jgi:hypothetical protein
MMNKTAVRAVIAIVLTVMAGGLLWAGVPALAAEIVTTAVSENTKPIAENLEYTTYRNIAVRGSFAATDPDGDPVTFEISTNPKKGAIQNGEDGSFVYTPNPGKKGRDSFTYVAIDSEGNISGEATVVIEIKKQSTDVIYSDMKDNDAYYAALVLAEKGVLTGEQLGNEYFFRPDTTVTRGEFLAMCLSISDTETLKDITRTGFYDDASIPMWAKPYVSTALMSGIISGYKNDEGRLIFASQEPITFSEAAVILNNVLKITDVISVSTVETEAAPVWAYQAAINLYACDILPRDTASLYNQCVTRADAAEMLVKSVELLNARDDGNSLLSWAKLT